MQMTLDFGPINVDQLDEFTRAYIEAALWSSTDDKGVPLDDSSYEGCEIAPDTLARMVADCAKFQAAHAYDIRHYRRAVLSQTSNDAYAGHDFWLNRNGHGCGFWDGGWTVAAGERMSEAAHKFGEFNLYVGDDGLIYGS